MDEVEADVLGRKVAVAIRNGNVQQAHAIIDAAVARQDNDYREMTVGERMSIPIANIVDKRIPHDTRIANLLEKHQIKTVGDLLSQHPEDLLQIARFSHESLERVYVALESIGFVRHARGQRGANAAGPLLDANRGTPH